MSKEEEKIVEESNDQASEQEVQTVNETVKVQEFKKATLILTDPSGHENNLGSIKRLNSFVSVRTKVTQSTVTITIMREADGAILTYVLPIAFDLGGSNDD